MRKINFLFAFILSVMGVTQAWADELTVYDGTDESFYVPIYSYYVDNAGGARTEFIVPKEMIGEMAGCDITSLSFYLKSVSQKTASWGGVTFDVYIREVDNSVVPSNWIGYDNGNANVYVGQIDATQSTTLTIDFDTPFTYSGNKNLLIGFYNEDEGSYEKCYFYGVDNLESGISRFGSNATATSFCPKTTFTFSGEVDEKPASTIYLKPTELWSKDGAGYALYSFNDTKGTHTWSDFVLVEKEYDIYTATVPEGMEGIVLVRTDGTMPATDYTDWSHKWNQTKNITNYSDNILYTITGNNGDECTYSRSTYVASTYVMSAVSELVYGTMLDATTKTFTLKNEGTGLLKNISFTNDEEITIANAPTELEAGASVTLSVTLDAEGAYSGSIEISADYAENVSINVSGTNVKEDGKFFVDFRTNDIPKSWDNVSNDEEQFEMNDSGENRNAYSSAALTLLTTSRMIVNEGDKFYFTAKRENSSPYYGDKLDIYYQTTEGTWESTPLLSLSASDLSNTEYQVFTLENVPVGNVWLGFNGKYVHIQQMCGFTEPTKTIGLKPTNNWDVADATERFAVYMWKGDGVEKIEDWADFTAVEGADGKYEATFNDAYTSIILTRMNGNASDNNWNNVWNQTEDITGENFYDGAIYTITSIDGGTEGKSTYTLGGITLALDEAATENQVVAGTYDEVTVAFTMGAGKFAAICLPFATTTSALGEGVKAWEFNDYENGNIKLIEVTELDGSFPYVVYAENGISGLNFQNVTIESDRTGETYNNGVSFLGTYTRMPAGTLTGKYGVTPAGKIQKAGSGASMKAFRAYFDGINQGAKLVFDGEIIGEATGIDTIENAAQTGELYDLQGRRVMNAQKGLYIQNGKKFVVK